MPGSEARRPYQRRPSPQEITWSRLPPLWCATGGKE
jgi:hypothetical protein